MNLKKRLAELSSRLKGKTVLVLGLSGILLIGLSSFLPTDKRDREQEKVAAETQEAQTADAYREALEGQIKSLVTGLTGDTSATVVVTLETGPRYSYASEIEESSNEQTGTDKSDSTTGVKRKYITVRTASGGEEALLVTCTMPEIRGVAVICSSAGDASVSEAIRQAVSAATGVSSRKIYVGKKSTS